MTHSLDVGKKVKERGMIFHGSLIPALLDGTKTMTRRLIDLPDDEEEWLLSSFENEGAIFFDAPYPETFRRHLVVYPFGVPGDHIWVRENHYLYGRWVETNGRWKFYFDKDRGVKFHGDPELTLPAFKRTMVGWHHRPSIFMPRWACRIILEIENLGAEGLQYITDKDCESEGVKPATQGDGKDWRNDESGWRRTFRQVWDSLHGQGSWDSKPWVWVYKFKRIEKEV